MTTADCHPITVAPGLNRLFLDYCAGAQALRPYYAAAPFGPGWQARPPVPAHWPELVEQLAAQNSSAAARASLDAMRSGAGVVVTGQQVGLFGGPLFSLFKAATALARARQATQAGCPHVAIFWLASEDHDFAEINHIVFPGRRDLHKLVYPAAPAAAVPVGGVLLEDSITPLVEQAWDLLGYSEAMEALEAAYKPGRSFAQAFAEFYSKVFAAQGLLVLDAGSRAFHRLGAPVLRAALERADELHAALLERNRELEAAGYHAQVAVGPQSSLLFLLDEKSGARVALKRLPPSAAEPDGTWQAGRQSYSTADLVAILEAEPERISPSALLRPVFQDRLLSTSLTIGGPAEIAYFAQSAVLFERILGRITPAQPRFSATLVEPSIGELLRRHELTLERVFAENQDSLTQVLAARAMPIDGKRKLAAAGNELDAELIPLIEWMRTLDAGLGRSAETAASKMRYQMNRLRRLAANFQLQQETSLARHATAISQALFPGGVPQERVHGAAFYVARYGLELAEKVTAQAADPCVGHTSFRL
ncbi:MAG: bacillithiol biosynthesis cysteine-adding enzyme BshC [Acidobacteriota bacterium]|nr:bacillithiol biosynthesis cysteine-adding enzyme BshC [Acidobacteriota bacterium]